MLPLQDHHRPTLHIEPFHAFPQQQEASHNQPADGSASLALLFASFLLVSWLMQIAAAQTNLVKVQLCRCDLHAVAD